MKVAIGQQALGNTQLKLVVYALCALLLSLGFSAEAQQPNKFHRIGVLSSGDAASESARSQGIRLALRDFGYVEGQNIVIEYRYAEGKRERAPKLASEFVRLKVALILVSGGTLWVRPPRPPPRRFPSS